MHKIKNEKYVGLVLALQKGGGGGESVINEVFYFSLYIEWFILQHDYSKVSEISSSEEKVHTDPTGAIVVVVIVVRN